MLRPHIRADRWLGLRAVGRMGLALAGGGVFAYLAWQPPEAQDPPERQMDADHRAVKVRLATADSEPAAASEGIFRRRSDPGSRAVAAIEPKGRPEATQVAGMATVADSSKEQRTRATTVAEGSGRSNPMAPPRGPP